MAFFRVRVLIILKVLVALFLGQIAIVNIYKSQLQYLKHKIL